MVQYHGARWYRLITTWFLTPWYFYHVVYPKSHGARWYNYHMVQKYGAMWYNYHMVLIFSRYFYHAVYPKSHGTRWFNYHKVQYHGAKYHMVLDNTMVFLPRGIPKIPWCNTMVRTMVLFYGTFLAGLRVIGRCYRKI
jgi:hypothetical protein